MTSRPAAHGDRPAHGSGGHESESEARFRSLVELSSDWYWEQDEQFRFTELSGPGLLNAVRDGDVSPYLGRTRWEHPDQEPVDDDWDSHRQVLERHEPFRDLLIRRRLGDGVEVYVRVSGQPVIDRDGRFRGYRGVGRNVTARTLQQIELRERIKELRCLYRVLELTTSDEYSLQEMLGKVASALPPSLLHDRVASARVVMQDEEFRSAGWRPPLSEMVLRSPIHDGSIEIGFVEVGYIEPCAVQSDGEGAFLREERALLDSVALHIGRMFHNRRMAEQLSQAQRMESMGQLTGGVAHDFNNLLTVILGNSELLAEQLVAQPQLAALAQMMGSAAQRGAELTQRLLAFARRQALVPREVDINALLIELRELLRRTLGEHVEIELRPAPSLWPALIDAVQLESALLNLCVNARDAMPDGGLLTIETANREIDAAQGAHLVEPAPGQYVMLGVSDTGEGIAREHLERVFEPFFTTKDKGKGTGLGLSMVYGFVKQSGGHVTIYSEPGHGTTVRLYLPRQLGVGDSAGQPQQVGSGTAEGGSDTILMVEDDELVRRYAYEQIRTLGYRVLQAHDGPSALAILRGPQHVDLLFTDVVMPGGMSGRALAEQALRLRPTLKVLYTSGYPSDTIVHKGQLDPGVRLLSKPYRRADLARYLREALE